MRFYRLVSGDLMDRTALSCHRTFYYDGQNLSSDVPCLRTCSTDPSGLLQACPLSGYGTGDHLQLRDFFRGILSGSFFQKLHICPWDYSHVPLQYKGVIRLDYAPLWFLPVSFSNGFFDKILGKSLENLTVILYDNWKESYFQ